MAEEKVYEVVITSPADARYQNEVLNYLMKNFSFTRVHEIDLSMFQAVRSLTRTPYRGTIESCLTFSDLEFRFILFKESRVFEIKIIYYVDESQRTVYITDFFPTSMDPAQMIPD